jgi:hypothetical protein
VAELVGGDPNEKVDITSRGARRQDVRGEPSSTNTEMRREVKTYREYLTRTLPDGTKVRVRNLVPADARMRQEIAGDVEFMKEPGPDGRRRVVQWDFTVSGPSDELRKLLIEAGIPFSEVHAWGKK